MRNAIAIWFYRLIEHIDGEYGEAVISYRIAQRIKMICLGQMEV
jgi:hypothetical protein